MRLNIQILLFTLSFVTCNSVLADNNTYAGIGFGSSSVDIASNALDDGSIITGQSTNDTDTSLSFFIGKRLSNRMSIEGGYIDLGVYSVTGFSDGSGSFWWPGSVAITIESTALYLNVVGHQEINPQLELIGKVGLYSASTDVALTDSWGTKIGRAHV